VDVLPDLTVPGITASQLGLVEPYFDAGGSERVANAPRGLRILRGVAQENGFRGLGHGRARVSVNSDEPFDLVLMSIPEGCVRGTFSAMLVGSRSSNLGFSTTERLLSRRPGGDGSGHGRIAQAPNGSALICKGGRPAGPRRAAPSNHAAGTNSHVGLRSASQLFMFDAIGSRCPRLRNKWEQAC
jgi:hypothetical protein